MNKLLIIDGNALMHRAYHALPNFLGTEEIPTNAIYGFASVLHKMKNELNSTHVLVCFDYPAPTFRDELFKEYRAQRPPTDQALIQQFPIIKEFLEAAGINYIEYEGLEADDLIAIYAKEAESHGYKVVILTGDKDLFQLVNDNIVILTPQIGQRKNGTLYDEQKVIDQFGVDPNQIADYKALVGDPSDNYKGIPGIGPKAAVKLLEKYTTLENIYAHLEELKGSKIYDLLANNKEDAMLAKQLAQLVLTSDNIEPKIDQMFFNNYNEKLKDFFKKYNIKSLQRRFFEQVQQAPISKSHADKKQSDSQLGLF